MTRSMQPGMALFCAALTMGAVARLSAQQPADVEPVKVMAVAEKLGVKFMPDAPRELELGQTVTTMLDQPKRLETYGIKDMHEGARVTITCVGPKRLRVEADEMEPAERRVVVTLHVNDDGSLAPAADRAPQKPPGS